jgi:hypothetical protein
LVNQPTDCSFAAMAGVQNKKTVINRLKIRYGLAEVRLYQVKAPFQDGSGQIQ